MNNIQLPLILLGGALAGRALAPISNSIINNALVNKIKVEVEKFKSSLSNKQNLIYERLLKRSSDLERFGKSGDTYEEVRNEVYVLKKELEDTFSRNQVIEYKELEKLNTKLAKRIGYLNKSSAALGAVAVLVIAHLNKNN